MACWHGGKEWRCAGFVVKYMRGWTIHRADDTLVKTLFLGWFKSKTPLVSKMLKKCYPYTVTTT